MLRLTTFKPALRALALVLTAVLVASACGSSDGTATTAESEEAAAAATAVPVATTAPVDIPAEEPTAVPAATAEPDATAAPAADSAAATESAAADSATAAATASVAVSASGLSCDAIAARFVTQGSANADLPTPVVGATCTGDSVVVTSNQIPDFPYIETSPGQPREYDISFTIPATPVVADTISEVAKVGPVAVAINGIPIYAATEGAGGDVKSAPSGFIECGGHNGPTGYHFHTFDVTGSDSCMFSEAEASAEPVLFGYSFDGFPIYGGNFFYTSSWQLTDESLFAIDTFSAHTYVEGSGDLDQCNGRTDENGDYAYYTTETFPYTLGCYAGVVSADNAPAGGGGGGQGGPPGDGEAPEGGAGAGQGGPPGDGEAPEGGAGAGQGGPPADGEAPEGGAGAGQGGPPADGEAPEGGAGGGPGGGGGPDFSEAAASLGVTVEALEAALGQPPFDFDAAAATLGVSAADLEAALPAPPGRPGG